MRTQPSPSPRSSTAAMPPISTISTRAMRSIPNRSMPNGRRFSQVSRTMPATSPRMRMVRRGTGRAGRCRSAAISSPHSTANGPRPAKAIGGKVKAQAQTRGVELSSADIERATRDSIRALMLIRAYRARGHFHANLDPLGIATLSNEEELDPRTYGFNDADLDRPIFLDKVLGPRIRHHPPDHRHPAPHLLPDARRRVPAHFQWRAEGLDPGAHRGRGQGDLVHPRGQARHPQQTGRSRRFRKILRPEIHRHQAFRSRRRRIDDPGARADHQARRRARRARDHRRHGASRQAQRLVPGHGQAAPRHLPRIQGRHIDARRGRRLGRRQIPSRRLVGPRVRPQYGASVAHRQSVASGNRRSGRARQGAGQAGSVQRYGGRPHHGDAAVDPRRRLLRRPGRDRGMFWALRTARPSHRRFGAFHRQQSDRLHHQSALLALVAVPFRRRQDDRGADLPRQRRRSRSRGVRRQDRDRVPAEIPEAGRHRHVLLPPPRPQRGRRAVLHPAA